MEKMKINKVSDLSSISVLPPHSRRSSTGLTGLPASQSRSQPSQQSYSHGLSSQHAMLSQFSQNSLDEVVTNDQRLTSQERESSGKKFAHLLPFTSSREDSQVAPSRTSTSLSLARKWASSTNPDHRSQLNETLEHRMGMMETSLNRFGMILDSVQSDTMQANRGTKEITLEIDGMRQKLHAQDNLLQLMNKEQAEIKANLDRSLKYLSDQMNKDMCHEKLKEICSVISNLPQQIEASILKLQNELHCALTKQMQQVTSGLLKSLNQEISAQHIVSAKDTNNQATRARKPQHPTKRDRQLSLDSRATKPPNVRVQTVAPPKTGTGGWKSVKKEKNASTGTVLSMEHKLKGASSLDKYVAEQRNCRVFIESDEEIDVGFSCLLNDDTVVHRYLIEEAKEETQRILRKARRRKRKCCCPIIIN